MSAQIEQLEGAQGRVAREWTISRGPDKFGLMEPVMTGLNPQDYPLFLDFQIEVSGVPAGMFILRDYLIKRKTSQAWSFAGLGTITNASGAIIIVDELVMGWFSVLPTCGRVEEIIEKLPPRFFDTVMRTSF